MSLCNTTCACLSEQVVAEPVSSTALDNFDQLLETATMCSGSLFDIISCQRLTSSVVSGTAQSLSQAIRDECSSYCACRPSLSDEPFPSGAFYLAASSVDSTRIDPMTMVHEARASLYQ